MMKYVLLCLIGLITTARSSAQEKGTGLIFDEASYASIPYKPKLVAGSYRGMPSSASLEAYFPDPGDQGPYSTCTAWAAAYHMRTALFGLQNNVTDKSKLNKTAFSAMFLYGIIKDSTDMECKRGSSPVFALNVLKAVGVPKAATMSASCGAEPTTEALLEAGSFTISDYQILFLPKENDEQLKIQSVKKSIAEGYPVLICFKVLQSFYAGPKVWKIQSSDGGPTGQHGMHAMCVAGYDDNVAGGAFKVINSWGTGWADKGYVWIPYDDFAKCCVGAMQAYYPRTQPPLPDPKPSPTPTPAPKPTPQPKKEDLLSGSANFTLTNGDAMNAVRVSTRNLVVEDASSRNEDLVAYRMQEDYPSGTRFRFFINTNTTAYIYAFATDLSGKVNKIFPLEDNMSALIGPNSTVAFPSESKVIRMDENKGSDYLLLLFSTKKLDEKAIERTMSATSGGLSKKITAALGSSLLPKGSIQYFSDRIGFDVKNYNGDGIVPLMIEINHK